MNTLSSIRTGLSSLSTMPGLRPESAATPRTIRPGELRELSPSTTTTPNRTGDAKPADGSFGNLLGRMVADVNSKQALAGQAVAGLQSGQPVALHQAMIAMEEASVSFQLMAEVRNKLLDSYQELMRMQV